MLIPRQTQATGSMAFMSTEILLSYRFVMPICKQLTGEHTYRGNKQEGDVVQFVYFPMAFEIAAAGLSSPSAGHARAELPRELQKKKALIARKSYKGFSMLGAEEGIRTPTPGGHHPLKMACLPIPPLRHMDSHSCGVSSKGVSAGAGESAGAAGSAAGASS